MIVFRKMRSLFYLIYSKIRNVFMARFLDALLAILLIIAAFLLGKKEKKNIVFGTTPIISYAYWCKALAEKKQGCVSLMSHHYPANKKSDFDLYYTDVTPKFFQKYHRICCFFALLYIMKSARMFVTSYDSVFFVGCFQRFEILLLKKAGVKVVIFGYGGDVYMYSHLQDLSLTNAMLTSYPLAARRESAIRCNVMFKNQHADCVSSGTVVDGVGRWDFLVPQTNVIDIKVWQAKKSYSCADGTNQEVSIVHSPNHRGVKGTEFIIKAVNELKEEGLAIKLHLLEGRKNSEVRVILFNSDILAEQLISHYGLSALEGMASGLPVLSNLSSQRLFEVFRRYSYLDECPIFSTTPETIKNDLRLLITRPDLREQLGRAGRLYVEKYHSYTTGQYMLGAIYDKIVEGKDVDLMNLYHPLISEYNKATPYVDHPLVENRMPLITTIPLDKN